MNLNLLAHDNSIPKNDTSALMAGNNFMPYFIIENIGDSIHKSFHFLLSEFKMILLCNFHKDVINKLTSLDVYHSEHNIFGSFW